MGRGFPNDAASHKLVREQHPVTILIQSALPIAMGEEDVAHKQGIGDVSYTGTRESSVLSPALSEGEKGF